MAWSYDWPVLVGIVSACAIVGDAIAIVAGESRGDRRAASALIETGAVDSPGVIQRILQQMQGPARRVSRSFIKWKICLR